MILVILKSVALGFLISLPLGPIGIFWFRKILQFGPLYGFILGIGQTLAILFFAIITIFGLGWISDYIIKYQFWLRLIVGFLLIGYGIKIFFFKSTAIRKKASLTRGVIIDFFSIAFITVISPAAFLAFLAIFAILGLYRVSTFFEHIEMILGILIGSIFAWMLICLCFTRYKKIPNRKVMTWINRSAGTFLVVFGVVVCISTFFLVT